MNLIRRMAWKHCSHCWHTVSIMLFTKPSFHCLMHCLVQIKCVHWIITHIGCKINFGLLTGWRRRQCSCPVCDWPRAMDKIGGRIYCYICLCTDVGKEIIVPMSLLIHPICVVPDFGAYNKNWYMMILPKGQLSVQFAIFVNNGRNHLKNTSGELIMFANYSSTTPLNHIISRPLRQTILAWSPETRKDRMRGSKAFGMADGDLNTSKHSLICSP